MKIENIDTYFGGKGGDGVYQTLINCIRPHDIFISPFLGNCAVLRYKKAAGRNIGLDLDPEIIAHWQAANIENLELHCQNGIEYLENLRLETNKSTVIYCDPPYPLESRRHAKQRYKFELTTPEHQRLLRAIKRLGCDVLISTYENEHVIDLATYQELKAKGEL